MNTDNVDIIDDGYLNVGKLYLCESDNVYHKWLIEKSAKVLDLKYEELPYHRAVFSRLRIYGIMEVPTVYYIDLDGVTFTKDLEKQIKSLQLRNRVVCLALKNFNNIQQYMIENHKTKEYPRVMKDYTSEWLDKYNFCDKMVLPRNINFESEEVKNTLIRLLIRSPEYWYTVSLLDNSFDLTHSITLEDLNTIFPDIDFYSLDEWIKLSLIGKSSKKHIQMFNYFVEVKKYNPAWLINKLRETYINVSYVYKAYREGLIFDGFYNNFNERADTVNFPYTSQFNNLSPRDKRNCFMIIEDMPYRYYIFLQEVLFIDSKEFLNYNESLVLLNSIHEVRKLYEKYDGTGSKVFNRKEYKRKRARN